MATGENWFTVLPLRQTISCQSLAVKPQLLAPKDQLSAPGGSMSASKLIRPPASVASSNEPPEVFLFPGLGGEERELHVLRVGCATALRGVPVDFPDWTEIYERGIDLDGFIKHCMEQIETHAPIGPLRLAGYSFGGIIAFAVASALAASGRAIARLGMLDTPTMPSFVNTGLSPAGRWHRFSGAVRRGETSAELGRLAAGVLARSGNPWLLRGAARIRHVRLPLDMDQHIAVPLQMRFRLVILRDLINRMAAVDVPLDIPAILFRCVEEELRGDP